SRTSKQPACIDADVPFLVGRLPTMTQPLVKLRSAVVSPIPPGHGPGSLLGASSANKSTRPLRSICTIVLPVPCRLRWLLKLLTSTCPLTSRPMVVGTTLTPYGLTSAFFGTVEAMVLMVLNAPMNVEALLATAGQPARIVLTRRAVTVSSLCRAIMQSS